MKLKICFLNLLCASLFFNSCKKSPDDPGISFLSRKQRVCGEWKVAKGAVIYLENNTISSYSIVGNTYSYPTSATTVVTGTAIVKFLFEKTGKCTVTINLGGYVESYDGEWNFTGGVGDIKSKTQIVIHITKLESGSNTYTYSGNNHQITYTIAELRNKKMKISYSDDITPSSGSISTYSEEWELIQ